MVVLLIAFGVACRFCLCESFIMFALLIFHLTAFEALYCGSWKSVELVSIRNGTMGVKFVDNQYVIQEKGPLSDIRIKSRQATLSDCTCFLRPSVDICVLLDPQQEESSDKVVQDPLSDIIHWYFTWNSVTSLPLTCLILMDARSDLFLKSIC